MGEGGRREGGRGKREYLILNILPTLPYQLMYRQFDTHKYFYPIMSELP